MEIRLIAFGEIEVEGERYEHDLLIERGRVSKRKKGPSKPYRQHYGHTPLSAEEAIPWHAPILYIGTGSYGSLPVMEEVYAEARRRGVEVVALPTGELCQELKRVKAKEVNAIIHITC